MSWSGSNILDLLLANQLINKILQLFAESVARGAHADGPAIFHYRHMQKPACMHEVKCIHERSIGVDSPGVARHDIGELDDLCIMPLRDHPKQCVTLGEYSDEPAVFHDHRSEEHTSELQSQSNIVCRLLLE